MSLKTNLNRHFALLDLDPRVQCELTNLLLLWNKSSGSKFVVARLKMLKLSLISYLNNEPDYLRHCVWIAKSKTKLKGPFGILFNLDRTKRHQIRRSLSIVNTYYIFFTEEKDRVSAEKEALDLIQAPYGGSNDYPKEFRPFGNTEQSIVIEPNFAGLRTSKPLWGGRRSTSKWFDSIMETSLEVLSYQEHLDASSIKPEVTTGDSWDYPDLGVIPNRHTGDLAFLHESGMKTRVICMPHAELQVVFSSFHKALVNILDKIPEDCTNDQESGALWGQSELSKGKTLFSIDLKSATDRFPLWLQLRFLKGVIPDDWINAFEVTARGVFKTPHGLVSYGTGQPMGLYGSFPLLALGQHGLVRMAGFLNRIPTSNQYRVLGDDIIFSNDKLAGAYRSLLEKYDIPISEHKSISGSIGEFCGFIITGTSINKGVKLKGNWKIANYLNYVKALGFIPSGIPSNIRKLIVPLVVSHEEQGGLGLNPTGLSHSERLEYFDPLYKFDKWKERKIKELSKLDHFIRSLLYTSSKHLGDYEIIGLYLDKLDTVISEVANRVGLGFLQNPELQLPFLEDPMFIGVHTTPTALADGIGAGYIKKKFPYYFLALEFQSKSDNPVLRQ
jgi:hypothetical protein